MLDSVREPGESSSEPPADLATDWIRVNGLNVRFAHAGGGPALVLVHGLLGCSFSWRRVMPYFAKRFEVFAPDMPGAGFSDCEPALDCHLSSAASRLLGFLDAVGVNSCDLVGSSYGGATAIILAALAPSRVRHLILVSPANPWSRTGRTRLALLRNPVIATTFPRFARPLRPAHDFFLRRMWGDPRRITRETYRGYFAPLQRTGVLEHAVKIVQTWNPDMRELQAALPRISHIPTLLLWGSKDRTVDPASAEPLRQNFQSAEMAVIQGAGHLPYEEYPEEFSRIVNDFLHSPLSSRVPTGK